MAFSEGRWDAANVDYATDLGMGVAAVAVPVAAVVAAVSFLAPRLDAQEISDWFWRTFREPSRQVDDTMDRVFGGVAEPRGGPPGGSGGNGVGGGLPQTRLLGGRPDLQQDVVLVVWTDEPPPPMVPEYAMEEIYDPPRHYWRGAAFDEYTGRGWSISAMTRTHISGEIPLFTPPYYRQVQQEVRFVVPHGDTLYALGEPVWITQPVEAVWYMPPVTDAVGVPVDAMPGVPDLAGLASTRMTYTVTSRLPEPMAGELRGSIPEYPEEISQRYLQLPVTVPERVRDLAVEVTADGRTAFDKAQLLERYLRLYPYSLDVEAPPEGVVDVADYFLFDLREGYCDYYATAYVIMARSVGIPARLSSGYVGGYYSTADGAYVVRESDGHSWPEVFFPGWGWIIFEPTGSQRPARFDEDVPVVPASVPAPTGPPARVVKTRWRMAVLAVLSVLLVAVFARRLLRHRRQRVSEISLSSVWMWVGQEGTRLDVPPDPALTPAEYARRLASELGARAERTSRRRRVWMERALATEAELSRLAGQYAREMYSGHRAVRVHSRKLDETWQALRAELHRFLWLGRLLVLTRRSWTGSGAAQGGERPG